MWYLIVPPVIVVVSLLFVLWYFSRQGADPVIAEKALQLDRETGQISFMRTKAFFLRLLEKMASRFKVMSLRAHNSLHDFTQSVKARQQRFQEKMKVSEVSRTVRVGTPGTSILSRWRGKKEKSLQPESRYSTDVVLQERAENPVVTTERVIMEETDVSESATSRVVVEAVEITARPMVSETVVHPEQSYERLRSNVHREEEMIARIAANPKDVEAYEGLGDHYFETGNVKDAKECYRQVLRLSPAHRMVKIKIRRLEKVLSQSSL